MYYLLAVWLIRFFGKKNSLLGFQKADTRKAYPEEKKTKPLIAGERYFCHVTPLLWDIIVKGSLLGWLCNNKNNRIKHICSKEHKINLLKGYCMHICSERVVQQFCGEHKGWGGLQVCTLNSWASQLSTRLTLFNFYVAWVKSSQFFVFKGLRMWIYWKLKAATKEFH